MVSKNWTYVNLPDDRLDVLKDHGMRHLQYYWLVYLWQVVEERSA